MFGFHPANLAFRFILEMAALLAIGVGAHNLADGWPSWLLAIGLPLLAAVAWGTFNVPGDRSRSGEAPVEVRGPVRLLIEFMVFGAAVGLLWPVSSATALVLGALVMIHYLLSLDRIRWLLSNW